ncbi:late competence protein ComER [Brevibacillus centrosporus]|nr:late competence protein ComER [Brevibacillus centrosporus]MEC2130971.1 late competence protein ComER [Brevibacillus centrosporus]RNB63368.1 late competence protein ComER [Brevibacillus centrosporus]GED31316.1 pyrroline-5-carboxylate reductase [Brevibacillus centrosporus]
MDRIGFIGTGSMGTILIEALLSSKALSPGQIMIGNRTPAKAERLAELYPGLVVAPSNAELAEAAKVLLLCVKPLEYKVLLEQITPVLTPEHLLITITSPIKLSLLEERVPCAVARVVPSITNAARSGISLCEFGSRIDEAQKQYILKLFSSISHPTMVSEAFLRVTSDITSCGPAFLSYILQQMIQEAVNETGISEDAATYLTTQMFIGMADLLKEDIFTLPSLQQRVCVPGGITGEGLIPLKEGISGLFTEVYRRTHAKFAEDQELVEQRLTNHQR